MATPTPSTNTPQKTLHAFSSPAPRSVPNTGTINFESPAALGIAFHDAVGGVGMGISMSGMGMSSLGLSASAMGRADEDERRRRLEGVIDMLKNKPGRVGVDGIIGLCNKQGLQVHREEKAKDRGSEQLDLEIGTEALCEISVKNGDIENVNLELAADGPDINFGLTGSKILVDSLQPLPGMTKINLTLERFSHNLDKLLRMDKLSAPENGGVSCYKAVFGIYRSLKKLFEHEKKMALAVMEANAPLAKHKAEREVLCKKSGRPRINAGNCLGLSLEYWMDRRHVIPRAAKKQDLSSKGKEKMDVDGSDEYPEDADSETNKIYSMTIECESSSSSMFTPIRVSDEWISGNIEKAPDAADQDINNLLLNRSNIDWLEPPPTYLQSHPPEGENDAMNLDQAPGRLPNIRFIAKFNPPLVVPLSVAVTINNNIGLPELEIHATTFVGLALRPGEPDPGLEGPSTESTQEIRSEKTVLTLTRDGKEEQRKHTNSLYVPKSDYSRTIESLPFSHPRQLIEILPTLRQYAFTNSLLQNTFGHTQSPYSKPTNSKPPSPPLTPKSGHGDQNMLQLDIALSYASPTPKLRIDLPRPSPLPEPSTSASSFDLDAFLSSLPQPPTAGPISVAVEIMANAELMVTDQNLVSISAATKDGDVDMAGAQEVSDKTKRIGRALDVAGDLGVWAGWLGREVEG